MTENDICAIVVTFKPEKEVLFNLANLYDQIRCLVVVDNSSTEEAPSWLDTASREMGFTFIQNGKNLGIAAALNIGIRWAELKGYQYVFLFDQDSSVTKGFVNNMREFYFTSSRRNKIAIVAPSYMDNRLNLILPSLPSEDGGLQIAMSSGCLMPIWIFHKSGWFAEKLFIDYVDYEYCLRVRSAGYLIEECREAILLHAPGDPKLYCFLGIIFLRTANYSASRRYYIVRNLIWLLRKYGSRYPSLCMRMVLNTIKDCVKIVLVEDDKKKKFHSAYRGLIDGIRGHMGGTSRF